MQRVQYCSSTAHFAVHLSSHAISPETETRAGWFHGLGCVGPISVPKSDATGEESNNNSSAVAEMGDRLGNGHNTHGPESGGGCCVPFRGGCWVPI